MRCCNAAGRCRSGAGADAGFKNHRDLRRAKPERRRRPGWKMAGQTQSPCRASAESAKPVGHQFNHRMNRPSSTTCWSATCGFAPASRTWKWACRSATRPMTSRPPTYPLIRLLTVPRLIAADTGGNVAVPLAAVQPGHHQGRSLGRVFGGGLFLRPGIVSRTERSHRPDPQFLGRHGGRGLDERAKDSHRWAISTTPCRRCANEANGTAQN